MSVLSKIGSFFVGVKNYLWLGVAIALGTVVVLWRIATRKAKREAARAKKAEDAHAAASASRDRVIDMVKAEVALETSAAAGRKVRDDAIAIVTRKTETLKAETEQRDAALAALDDAGLVALVNKRREKDEKQ